MSKESYDDVLRLARQLPREQQKLLVEELTESPAPADSEEPNGKTVGEALREFGLLGSLTDVPADYGTNPKYMEGFGEHAD